MAKPIPLPPGNGDVVLARCDLAALMAEVNDARAPANPEAILRVLADVRVAVEKMLPELDYFKVSALSDYLRAISNPVHEAERRLYPGRAEKASR